MVLTTIPNKEAGEKIARNLIEKRLAACVTISPPSHSLYWWQGKIEEEEEHVLLIKTKKELFSKLERKILELHPYEVPEIIAIPLIKGYIKYLDWIDKETGI